MGKREIPLFVFDKNREHGIGECDFVCCTDIDNGFIAKIDYTDEPEGVTERTRIGKPNNGISLRIEIKRIESGKPVCGKLADEGRGEADGCGYDKLSQYTDRRKQALSECCRQ